MKRVRDAVFCFAVLLSGYCHSVEIVPTTDGSACLSGVMGSEKSPSVLIGKVEEHVRQPGDLSGFFYSTCKLQVEAIPVGNAVGDTVAGLIYRWDGIERRRDLFQKGDRILLVVRMPAEEEMKEKSRTLGGDSKEVPSPPLWSCGTLGWVWSLEKDCDLDSVVRYVKDVAKYAEERQDPETRLDSAKSILDALGSECLAVRSDTSRMLVSDPELVKDAETLNLLDHLTEGMNNPRENPYNRVRLAGVLFSRGETRADCREVAFSILADDSRSNQDDPIIPLYLPVYRQVLEILKTDKEPATADRLFGIWFSDQYRFPEDYNSYVFWDTLIVCGNGRGLEIAVDYFRGSIPCPTWLKGSENEKRTEKTLANSLARRGTIESVTALLKNSGDYDGERRQIVEWAVANAGSDPKSALETISKGEDRDLAKIASQMLEIVAKFETR